MTHLTLLKRLFRNKQVHNFGFLFSIQASNILISIITIPLIVGTIGVEQLGQVDLALSIVNTLNILVSYGYNLSAPREIAISADRKGELSKIFSKVLFSKLMLAVATCFSLILAVSSMDQFDRNGMILLLSGMLLFAEALFPHWLAQGLEKMRILSVGNLLSKLIYLGLIVLFVKSPAESSLVNFFLGVSGTAINLSLIIYISRNWGIVLQRIHFVEVWRSLKQNFYLFLSSVAGYVSINSGIIILSFFVSDYLLGAFSLADRVIRVLRLVPTIVIQAIYPQASKLYVTDKGLFSLFLRRSYFLALLVCLMISIATFLLAPIIVELLAKERLHEAVRVLKILAFVPLFACLNIANMILVLVSENQNSLVNSTWVSFCLMLVICACLAYFYGTVGLASGLLLTELLIFAVQLHFNLLRVREDTIKFYAG
jgi:O-antigen/teichoic acid export membrane protein